MIGGIRIFAMAFLILTVVFVYLSIRQRWRTKRALGVQFDKDGIEGDREEYIEKGLEIYEGSFRRKLILSVYIIPMLIVAVMVYVTNFM